MATVGHEHRGRPLEAIPGSPPDLAALPPGCSFAPRCSQASERCHRDIPPLEQQGARTLACWHPVRLLGEAA